MLLYNSVFFKMVFAWVMNLWFNAFIFLSGMEALTHFMGYILWVWTIVGLSPVFQDYFVLSGLPHSLEWWDAKPRPLPGLAFQLHNPHGERRAYIRIQSSSSKSKAFLLFQTTKKARSFCNGGGIHCLLCSEVLGGYVGIFFFWNYNNRHTISILLVYNL